MVLLNFRSYIRLVYAVLGLMGDTVERVTLKGLTGSGASGTRASGFSTGAGSALPLCRASLPGASLRAGGTTSTCSNVDQIHCGRVGVFCTMCSPANPTVAIEQRPV